MTKRDSLDYVCRVTPMQEGMLFESLNSPGGQAYISVLRFRVGRALDGRRLERRWEELAGRYGMLRTTFKRDGDGVFWQAARRGRAVPFACRDIGGCAPGERETVVLAAAAARAAEGMNPLRDALCRLDVFYAARKGRICC